MQQMRLLASTRLLVSEKLALPNSYFWKLLFTRQHAAVGCIATCTVARL